MKYFSEITKKTYDTEEECLEAEKTVSMEKEERKLAAKRVDEAENNYLKAREAYITELNNFCNKYGAYHKTISSNNLDDFKKIYGESFLDKLFWY